ncbi:hypothetical protein ABIC37_005296 [Priestia megaterium]|nr:hypothetical protein [Priestia megaterium]
MIGRPAFDLRGQDGTTGGRRTRWGKWWSRRERKACSIGLVRIL